jgi:hypothetical protein
VKGGTLSAIQPTEPPVRSRQRQVHHRRAELLALRGGTRERLSSTPLEFSTFACESQYDVVWVMNPS